MVEPITTFIAALSFLKGLWSIFKRIKKWFKKMSRTLYTQNRNEMTFLRGWFNDNHRTWGDSRPLPDYVRLMVEQVGQTTYQKYDEAPSRAIAATSYDDDDDDDELDCVSDCSTDVDD